MIGNRHSGDNIAAEFMKILGPKLSSGGDASLEKVAQEGELHDGSHMSETENNLEEVARDMLEDGDDSSGDQNNDLDDAINMVENMLSEDGLGTDDTEAVALLDDGSGEEPGGIEVSASDRYLISGLGKIAGGLRHKNEGFAADMVEATARSIYNDISKEASSRTNVVNNLSKIARELSSSGDALGADLVAVTMNKIRKG